MIYIFDLRRKKNKPDTYLKIIYVKNCYELKIRIIINSISFIFSENFDNLFNSYRTIIYKLN